MDTTKGRRSAIAYKSFYELNRDLEEKSFYLNVTENAIDSLESAVAFIDREDTLRWKWVSIAVHNALYSFCIACLAAGGRHRVLAPSQNPKETHYWQLGENQPWQVSSKAKRPQGHGYTLNWTTIDGAPPTYASSPSARPKSEYLIGIWTALARVQDKDHWMASYSVKGVLVLSEEEWKSIEWLTERVRNACLHFGPTSVAISIERARKASLDIIRVIEFLALDSGVPIYNDFDQSRSRVTRAIRGFRQRVGGSAR